jgi:hypothetical protein
MQPDTGRNALPDKRKMIRAVPNETPENITEAGLIVRKPPLLLLPSGKEPLLLIPAVIERSGNENDPLKDITINGSSCVCAPRSKRICAACRLRESIGKMIAAHKLSRESLCSLLTVLGLGNDFAVLTSVQSRRLRHLLDYLTVRSEIAGCTATNAADWKFWLDAEFPQALFAHFGIVRSPDGYAVNPVGSGKKPNKRKKSKKKTTAESAFSAQTDFQVADATITGLNGCPRRQPISAELYRTIAVRQGSFCFWCGAAVAREAEIPLRNRIAKTSGSITFLNADGGLSEKAVATIDHLVRVTDGGDNAPGNLVISCLACNYERERITAARKSPFVRTRIVCKGCGGSFFHPGWNCCSVCGASADHRTSKNTKRIEVLFRSLGDFIGGIISRIIGGLAGAITKAGKKKISGTKII